MDTLKSILYFLLIEKFDLNSSSYTFTLYLIDKFKHIVPMDLSAYVDRCGILDAPVLLQSISDESFFIV